MPLDSWSLAEEASLKELHRQGLIMRIMAERLGKTRAQVRAKIIKLGLSRPKPLHNRVHYTDIHEADNFLLEDVFQS